MKLIIDIHERDYRAVQNGLIPYGILNAIKSGISLDNIKEKIHEYLWSSTGWLDVESKEVEKGIFEIIDKYKEGY